MENLFNDPYNYNSIFYKAKRTVYKWWCVVYKPVYKLVHNGYFPPEKEPDNLYPKSRPVSVDEDTMIDSQVNNEAFDRDKALAEQTVREMAEKIMKKNAVDISEYIEEGKANQKKEVKAEESNATTDNDDALLRAQEIIDRLNREAAEDEAKKQAEIDAAKIAAGIEP